MPDTLAKRVTFGLLSPSLAMLLTLGLSIPSFAQSQPQVDLTQKNVLILHTLESSTPLSSETNRGLLDTLRIGGIPGANLFFESMDLRRNPGPELRKLLVEQMRLKWSHRKADMIITVYPEALEFVLNDCRDVFPHIPIIALHLPQNYMMAETGRRIIGHFPTYDITGTIDNALKLVPGTKRVYVVSGAHKVDKWLEDQARRASKKWERVEFLYVSHMPLEEILATVSKAPPCSVILYLSLTQDVAGKSHTGLGLAHQLSQVSTVPVFGLFESALGYGVTGGTLISWDLIGKRAGQLVIDILKGVKTLDDVPPVLDVPSVPMFDWRQLRRWNLSEAALPKGSIIVNRETTFWDFKYYIIGGLALCLLQSLLIAGLLLQRRRKIVAEASLRQKKEELNQFFNITLDLLCIATTDGYFVRLNPTWERILGYTREELMARPFFDFIHPDDVDKTREAVSTLSSQQKLTSFENRYRCKDGTYRGLEWSSAPAGKLIYTAARDVTERKQAEQALQNSEEKFRQFFKNTPDYCYIISTEGNILHINEAALKTLRYKREELVGQPLARIYAPESLAKMEDLFTQWKESGQIRDEEMVIVTRKGERRVVILNVGVVKDKDGMILHSTSVQTDITERKRAEQEALDARRELTRMERLSRMGELSASLSHELNQPLTAILSNARAALRFLQTGKLNPGELEEILQDIVKDDKRAGDIIRNLRAMVKPDEGEQELTSINDVLHETVALFRSEAIIRNVRIKMDLADALPLLHINKVQIQQVLINLMMNATESMTENDSAEKVIVLQTAASGEGVVKVAVRDFGSGIEEQELRRIFEPFFTTKRSGLGMGLSLSRSIIESHGGHIWAENNPDKGITFYFDLPAITDK
jgi:PAS domain S-box-containing protein